MDRRVGNTHGLGAMFGKKYSPCFCELWEVFAVRLWMNVGRLIQYGDL